MLEKTEVAIKIGQSKDKTIQDRQTKHKVQHTI